MTSIDDVRDIVGQATQFVGALAEWEHSLATVSWQEVMQGVRPEQVAVFSIDMVNGFCHEGALASPRVKGIIPAVLETLQNAYAVGVRNFILAQDCHPTDAAEFADFAPHCQVGSSEAEMIPELAALPFADSFTIVAKNSLNAFHGTHLDEWLQAHDSLQTVVIVGDCTDLCVYQTAMHLKLYANAYNLPLRVLVPENAVQTYDMPLATAQELGIFPHNGDVLHLMFLYHMRLNGVEVVRALTAR